MVDSAINIDQPTCNAPPITSDTHQDPKASTVPIEINGLPPSNGTSGMPAPTSELTINMNGISQVHYQPGTSSMMQANMAMQQGLTAEEIAQYDRQLRLWGVKAQENIRAANVLLIGMKALGNEIAKNLVLAGIGSLTILDHEMVVEDDLCSQFLISEEQVGENRAEAALQQVRRLNPRVRVFADTNPLLSKLPEYFSTYDITIATGLGIEILSTINASCRIYNRKFYAADTHGMYGYVFADLVQHSFMIEREKGNISTKLGDETSTRSVMSVTEKRDNNKVIEVVTKSEIYSPFLLANSSPLPANLSNNSRSRLRVTPLLSCLRALFDFQKISGGRLPLHNRADLEIFTKLAQDKHLELQLPVETLRAEFLRSFIQNLGSEISPVVAFLGGNLAQDVINVLGQREQPLQNLLLFDGEEFKGPVYSMHPIFDDSLLTMGLDSMTDTNGYLGASMNGMANGMTMASAL